MIAIKRDRISRSSGVFDKPDRPPRHRATIVLAHQPDMLHAFAIADGHPVLVGRLTGQFRHLWEVS